MPRSLHDEDGLNEDDVDGYDGDDLEDEDEDVDSDLDDEDVDEEARAFYEEFAAPMTPEDTVARIAAAASDAPSWYRAGRIAVPAMGDMVCRGCGCSDNRACQGGCFWAAPNLCSRCV